jgi:hypothetical protein
MCVLHFPHGVNFHNRLIYAYILVGINLHNISLQASEVQKNFS